MKQNLDVLKTEIQEHLQRENFVVFFGHSRGLDPLPIVVWDSDRYPDYRQFLKTATAAGAKIVVLHSREFGSEVVDTAIDELDEVNLTSEERRGYERRLREMRAYDGFTCSVELSFDVQNRAYIFELRTEWFEEFENLLEEIDSSWSDSGAPEDEGPIGGYYSKN